MKKFGKLKKYIVIVAVFLTVLLTFAGSAMWLILTEVGKALENLTTLNALTIEYKPKNATAMYYGDSNGYTSTGEKVYYQIGNTKTAINGTWFFDVDGDTKYESTIDDIMTSANSEKEWFKASTDGTYYNLNITKSAKFVLDSSTLSSFVFRADYVVPQVTLKIPMLVVAEYNGTYYTTMDAALTAVQNKTSGTLYALSSNYTTESTRALTAKTITKPASIPNGVIFSIPYNNEKTDKRPNDDNYFNELPSGTSNVSNAYNTNANCTNIVTLSNSLNISGSLYVYAYCMSGGGANFAGNVTGQFGKLIFSGENASIATTNTAKIYSFGFIEADAEDPEKFKFVNGAKLYLPFTLYEWRGGNITNEIANTITPFLRFTVPNVVGAYQINYGATITAKTSVTVSILGEQSAEQIMIGSSDDAFLQLKSGSFVNVYYSADPIDKIYGKSLWEAHGGAFVNSIEISVAHGAYKINTTGKFLPLTYLMELSLFDGEYDITGQDVKLLPGAKVKINANATAKINNLIIYSETPPSGITSNKGFPAYPTDVGEAAMEVANDGTLIVYKGIAGNFPATQSGATIQIANDASTSLTSQEYHDTDGWLSFPETLSLPSYSNVEATYSTPRTYYSAQRANRTYGWYASDFSVTLNANGGTVSSSSVSSAGLQPGAGIVVDDLPEPNRPYYNFKHWCTEPSCSGGNSCPCPEVLYETKTLTAIWEAKNYKINYVVTVDGQPVTDETLRSISFTIPDDATATTPRNLPEITDRRESGLTWVGWSFIPNGATDGFKETPSYADLVAGATQNSNGVYERTVYAVWIEQQFNITFATLTNPYGTTFKLNGVANVSVNYYPTNESVISENVLAHDTDIQEQYYFEGWYVQDASGNNVKYVQGTSSLADYDLDGDGNVTLYAKWDTKYTLTLAGSSGDANQPNQKVTEETYYFLESQLGDALSKFDATYASAGQYNTDPTVSKYFAGWSGIGEVTPEIFDANKIKTFNADWQDKIKVTYSANGGTCGTTANWYYEGTNLTLPTATRGDYYKFTGWYTAASGGTKVGNADASYTPTADVTLYAQWQGYTVTYNANGGTCDTASATYAGTALQLPAPARDNHQFLGWFTAANGGEKIGNAGASYTPTADITLYAQWQEIYTVTYNANGGTCSTTTQMYMGTTPLTLPNTTRDGGYHFLGWYTAASGGTLIGLAGESYAPTDNVTLYARWQKEYTVTYDANGGTCSTSSALFQGKPLELPTPTRTGYKCLGWFTEASGGTKVADAGASYTPTANITLYAQWEKQLYTITITKQDNATVTVDKTTAYYGETITVTVSFTQNNSRSLTVKDASEKSILSKSAAGTYTFTMPASNVTIEASSSSTCVATGSLITLADGTQKKIEDVTYNDMLLVWDFFKGEYTVVPAAVIVFHGNDNYEVVTLKFSDGTEVRTIATHDFFDVQTNQFVSIDKGNVASFIGHEFIKMDSNGYTSVTLVDYSIADEYTGSYSILSVFHINAIVNGMLSLTPTPVSTCDQFFKYFMVGEDMKYDEEQMQADIEKYGLYTYEDFAEYATYEQFVALNAQYYKILVGKGLLTYEEILYAVNTFVHPYT